MILHIVRDAGIHSRGDFLILLEVEVTPWPAWLVTHHFLNIPELSGVR